MEIPVPAGRNFYLPVGIRVSVLYLEHQNTKGLALWRVRDARRDRSYDGNVPFLAGHDRPQRGSVRAGAVSHKGRRDHVTASGCLCRNVVKCRRCLRPRLSLSLAQRVNAADTPAELRPDLQLEIAHLLLLDVVGYSKLLVEEQVATGPRIDRNRARDGMLPQCGTKRQTHSSSNGRRNGAGFLLKSGRTGAVCARNQQSLAKSSADPITDGNS